MKDQTTPRSGVASLPVLGGLLAGAAVSLVMARWAPRAPQAQAAPLSPSAARAQPAVLPPAVSVDRGIEFRLGRLEAQANRAQAAAAAVQDAALPDFSPEAAERARAAEQQRFDDFARQPVDARWAASMQPPLEEDLSTLAEAQGFKVASVECRAEACLVRAQWPSHAQASAHASALAHEPLRVNCPRRIMVTPDLAGAPGEVQVLLECADWKAQGSTLLADLPSRPSRPNGQAPGAEH